MKQNPKKYLSGIVAVTVIMLFAACEKSFGIESSFNEETTISIHFGQTAFSPQEQVILMEAIQSRRQIANTNLYDNVYTVSFQGEEDAHLPCEVFPLVNTEDNRFWKLNGIDTDVPIRQDEEGRIILPMLIPLDGIWYLDTYESSISTESYLEFCENCPSVHVAGMLEFQDVLYVYESDGTVGAIPIIKEGFYRVPGYWLEHLVEKEMLAEQLIAESDGDCASFVFFTDTHWGKNMKRSPSLIKHIVGFTPIDDVLFGGDAVTTHSTNLVTPMETGQDFQASFAFLGTRFHCLYGNHDNNSDSQPGRTEYHLSDQQVFSWLQSQMTDVVYGDYFNFYYDNPLTKTRIIGLDTGRYYYTQFRDKILDTVQFAVDALASVPEGWHVIIASHIWCSTKKQSDGTYSQYLDSFIKPVLKVFDDYNARTDGVFTYKKQTVAYDFTDAGATIEFCIGGHTHANFTTHSEGGIPVIIVVSDYFSTPERGTAREQSVTLVIADYQHRKLNLIVVGRGADRHIDL